MADFAFTVEGAQFPQLLLPGYRQTGLAVALLDGTSATWVSLAGTAMLATVNADGTGITPWDPSASDGIVRGILEIVCPFELTAGQRLVGSVGSATIASFDVEEGVGQGWGVYLDEVSIRLSGGVFAEVVVALGYSGDFGLNRVGFKADLLVSSA